MTTKQIDVGAKISLKELIAQARQGIEIILTEDNKPVARLLPVAGAAQQRILGLHEGSIWTSDDFDAPLPDEFWLGEDA